MTLSSYTASNPNGPALKTFTQVITLGKTLAQDILIRIGPPDSTFTKRDDRMLIHTQGQNQASKNSSLQPMDDTDSKEPPVFWNWYRYGLDILFDSTHGKAIKIIAHSNVPGHFNFDR